MSSPQELNFEGGPWKLRNGNIVEKLTSEEGGYSGFINGVISGWDENGNSLFKKEEDIISSCYNWKYLRSQGLEE